MCSRFFCGSGTITAQTHRGNKYVLQNIVFLPFFTQKIFPDHNTTRKRKDTHSITLHIIAYKMRLNISVA